MGIYRDNIARSIRKMQCLTGEDAQGARLPPDNEGLTKPFHSNFARRSLRNTDSYICDQMGAAMPGFADALFT